MIGQKLNYSEFKRINLMGPMERVIKLRKPHKARRNKDVLLSLLWKC